MGNRMLRVGLILGAGLVLALLGGWSFTTAPAMGANIPAPIEWSDTAPVSSAAQAPVIVPSGKVTVTVDGYCREYTEAAAFDFADAFEVTGTVYLKHDNTYLYVCMQGAAGSDPNRFARVYLDTDNGREPYAEADDYGLSVGIVTPTLSSVKGTGVAGGYVPVTLDGWSASATAGNSDGAEYAIPLNLTGGWCGASFGIAVYHHWLGGSGDDYGWPSSNWYDQPQTWQEASLAAAACGTGNIAYVYKNDTATAGDVKSLLEAHGFSVQWIPLSAIPTTDFSKFGLIIVADDTGYLNDWGTAAGQVATITSADKPIMGLGEGGYAFFGRAGSLIGWPNGWHGWLDRVYEYPGAGAMSYYHVPYELAGLLPIPLYSQPMGEVGIYLGYGIGPDVVPIGLEPYDAAGKPSDHAPLIADDAEFATGCYQLWGYAGGPKQMVLSGQRLFVNAVTHGLSSQCVPKTPPPACVTLTKTASPEGGTNVKPGDVISYSLSYTVSPNCTQPAYRARLLDKIPADTLFVPGSASDGITPGFDKTLAWDLGELVPGATGTKTFQAYVLDTQCHNQRRVNNTAQLVSSLGIQASNLVSHGVDCPPVTFPTNEPPYAEDDIQIYPYPLVTGQATHLSVRVRNLSLAAQTVTVTFQTSPNRFGIGLDFADLAIPGNPAVITLPPSGTVGSSVIVELDWTPISSGHYCISVKAQAAGYDPIFTYRNLDVAEDLRPGVEDVLTFTVGNPTPAVADIVLVVDNTCPGWTAWVSPTVLAGVGPNSGDLRTAELHVVPPTFMPLGTACHIDVQGWANGKLIGGIRKLDVPPVHLPEANPPWEEKEISTSVYPPVVGQPVSYCVELQNPLAFARVVTIEYAAAYFGAGLPFTPVGSQSFVLPPYSLAKYCITWTPAVEGHTCLQVTLKQAGFQDQFSQRNIQVVKVDLVGGPVGIQVPFVLGNPYPFTRTLGLRPILIGLRGVRPRILPDPPPELGLYETRNFTLELVPEVGALSATGPGDYGFGDSSRVEMGLYLDDELEGGFTVEYEPVPTQLAGKIAYVYRGNTPDATSFYNLLTSRGYSVTLVTLGSLLSTGLSPFDLILVADDTGELNNWGSASGQVEHITDANKPILGLGEGGYAFFGKASLLIGWPHGWHGPNDRLVRASGAPTTIYAWPDPIPPDPVQVYGEPVNEVGIYLGAFGGLPSDVVPIGLEPLSPDHASLILQGCRQLWGFSGNADAMTATGHDLFVNDVEYMRHFQCPAPLPPPPAQCLAVTKSATPPDGTAVQPGDVIAYTLVYTVSDDPACQNERGRLVDTLPPDTIFVPGSASDGIAPTPDGSLIWDVGPALGGTKNFKVRVSDTQCNDQRTVYNRAGLLIPGNPPVTSNVVWHPVTCPPVTFPNDEPPYAESEIQIHPYPLVTGHPSEISVLVSNISSATQVLTVSFQTSPDRFGIGLNYADFDSQVVTVPPYGNVIVKTTFTPVSSGHYCIQVKVQGSGFAPIYTQHNIDVTEDLQPGVTDVLKFKVRNSGASEGDIDLVVVNTCPGWSAVVSPTLLAGMAAGEVRDAELLVTPPNPVTLGTACHIDVQAWLGDQLIGGIRKLDVPPVHLPRDVQPPWLEPEITVQPNPPIVGQPVSYCIELQNPIGFARVVTLVYSVADFGAGIAFTPVATRAVTLPAYSLDKYCITWTPTTGGTLHRCLLVTLKQPGYQDEHSQRNVDLVQTPSTGPGASGVVGVIRNPDPVTHTLLLKPVIYGIDPFWKLRLLVDPGDPPPDVIGPNQVLNLQVGFMPQAVGVGVSAAAAAPADWRFGDESRVDIGVYMDEAFVGGFSVNYQAITTAQHVFLPVVLK